MPDAEVVSIVAPKAPPASAAARFSEVAQQAAINALGSADRLDHITLWTAGDFH
jgi:hypothetical protein